MNKLTRDYKKFNLEDVQENFEQVFNDVLVSVGPLKITRDAGNAILVSEEIW